MAGSAKVKPAGGGQDIRAFYKSTPNNTQKSQPTSSLDTKKNGVSKTNQTKASVSTLASSSKSQDQDVIMVDDSDDEPPAKGKSGASIKPRKSAVLLSSDGEAPPKPVKAPPRPKPKAETSNRMEVDTEGEAPRRSSLKRKKPSALVSSDDDSDEPKIVAPPKKKVAVTSGSSSKPVKPRGRTSVPAKKKVEDSLMTSTDDDDEPVKPKAKPKAPAKKAAKKKVEDSPVASSDDDDEPVKPRAKPKKAAKKGDDAESKGKKKAAEETKKAGPDWAAIKAAKERGPVAPGSKEVPDGEENCLLGLAFVFTGELSSFSRDEAIDLAKRFGGRVVGQPSSKTNFVVLGEGAGPSKLEAIRKHGLKTINEDQFLNLIATRKGNGKGLDEKTKKKMEKEQAAIKATAKEMDRMEKEAAKEAEAKNSGASSSKAIDPTTQLWTTRYAPQSLKDICGNKGQVEKLQLWLKEWPSSHKSSFKKPGKNGMNMYRAVLISGSPGIGKTTSAHLCAKLAGYTPIELNASDTRSKKLVENGMNINNKSLDSFISGSSKSSSDEITDRTCLIMDEVDGMSAGDRGGVGALNALIKKSKIPIICIANDKGAQKLKPLMSTTYGLSFSKPQATMIRSRIMSIAYREKMKIPANVVDQLISGSQSDIRQVLTMLSTWKLSSDTMSFEEGKEMSKLNEKYSIMSPFDITSKVLGPYLFSHTARETLGEKMEYYFQDHSFVPLFIQENYLKTQPAKVRNDEGPEKDMKLLQLMDQAASSISDADLVDCMIHGSEQHWSLMPLHAVCSTIRPASFIYGTGAHYGGQNSMAFPQWLGQNSKQNKLNRQLGDVQVRMRLKVSGDKTEIRQSYIPALHPHIVRPLVDEGSGAVDEIIERMDEYFLSREDWDTIVELGVGDQKDDLILKKIPAATKTAFTRKYNSSDHPIPFHKAQDLGKAPKKLAVEQVPDLEEAFDFDEVVEDASEDEKNAKDPDDIGNYKLIKTSKQKKATGKAKK